MLSSAGITRPDWPNEKKLALEGSAAISTVRLNPFGILGLKRESEERLRTCGIPPRAGHAIEHDEVEGVGDPDQPGHAHCTVQARIYLACFSQEEYGEYIKTVKTTLNPSPPLPPTGGPDFPQWRVPIVVPRPQQCPDLHLTVANHIIIAMSANRAFHAEMCIVVPSWRGCASDRAAAMCPDIIPSPLLLSSYRRSARSSR